MSDNHILLIQVMERHDINVKQLACRALAGDSTIYKYRSGEIPNIPVEIWRSLYALTLDERLPALITGTEAVIVVPITAGDDDSAANLMTLIELRQQELDEEKDVLEILKDGKIDKNDYAAIMRLKESHPQSMIKKVQLFHAIMKKFEKASR